MTALSAPRPGTDRLGEVVIPPLLKLPVAASVKIWAGAQVMVDAGYAKPATETAGKLVVGRAESTVDNTTGSAGDKVVVVRRGVFKWKNSSSGDAIAQAQVGTVCYAVDDQTVAKTSNSGARSPAGVVLQVESDGVLVQQGLLSESEVSDLAATTAAAVSYDNAAGLGGLPTTVEDALGRIVDIDLVHYAVQNTAPDTSVSGAVSHAYSIRNGANVVQGVARVVLVRSIALSADDGDISVTTGTLIKAYSPAAGVNEAWCVCDAGGNLAITLSGTAGEAVTWEVRPDFGLGAFFQSTFGV